LPPMRSLFCSVLIIRACMHEAHGNEQNFKTSGSNSAPLSNAPSLYQMPHHYIKCPTIISNAPPHGRLRTSNSLLPGEDLKSNSRGMPGGCWSFELIGT
jgi:hypothetical protein